MYKSKFIIFIKAAKKINFLLEKNNEKKNQSKNHK